MDLIMKGKNKVMKKNDIEFEDGYVVYRNGELSTILDNECDIREYLQAIDASADDDIIVYKLVRSEYKIVFKPTLVKE